MITNSSVSICCCSVVSNSLTVSITYECVCHGLQPVRLLCPWDLPGKNTGVGCHSLLQGIFLTQGSNPGLLQCRQILYQLSHQGTNPIFFFLAAPWSMWDLSFLTRYQTPSSPALEVQSYPLDCQASPIKSYFLNRYNFTWTHPLFV